MRGARGKVGPSLDGIAGRVYIAGRLSNTPENLEAWIVDPQAIDPKNKAASDGLTWLLRPTGAKETTNK